MKMTVRKETYGKNLFIDIETEKTIKTYILCAGEITLMNITRK